MKKNVIISITVIIALIALYFVGTGFQKRADTMLIDYSVSEDGTEIAFSVQAMSSMGFIRGYKDNGGGEKPHYLTFYSTFGGINSSFGAKNTFILEIEPNDTKIYFNRSNGEYELVLVKDEETGAWLRYAYATS